MTNNRIYHLARQEVFGHFKFHGKQQHAVNAI